MAGRDPILTVDKNEVRGDLGGGRRAGRRIDERMKFRTRMRNI
jgi:hypothetical protein